MTVALAAAHVVVEWNRIVEARNAERVVPWWSFTKTVIAAASLVLVQDGRLALDTPLPDRCFTLAQLLQHRAGVPNYGGLAAYHEAVSRGTDPWPVSLLLERTGADRQIDPLADPPGRGWAYSNIGYLFVRRLIEDVTGEPLGVALTRLVLRPLGIRNVGLAEKPDDLPAGMPNYHPGWVYHGLLIGALDDAALLLHRLMSGALLRSDLLDRMRSPHILQGPVPNRPWASPGYGLGLMIGTGHQGQNAVGHTGQGPGSVVAVYHFDSIIPERTVATFSMSDDQAVVENARAGAWLIN
jgi:CubicO group peptidase (beta-lactamase class C family)